MLSTRFSCLSNVNLVYIHQLIVAAIRELGGRFLEYDEQSQTYHDIGNKRAWDKTSQALREGLTKIRREVYSDVAAGRYQSFRVSPCRITRGGLLRVLYSSIEISARNQKVDAVLY